MSEQTNEQAQPLPNLYNFDLPQLQALLGDLGQQKFRAKQLWHWLYERYASSFDEMTTLPQSLRKTLSESTTLDTFETEFVQHSNDGQTEKHLFKLGDGRLIETVLMRYDTRRTLCISTQAGCAMGCVFCATGQMGFYRHLSVAEIVTQVVFFGRELAKTDERVTNIVLMGMGEPLHNYDNTLAAIDCLTDANGINLGARKITISTVGHVPAIRRYADEQRQTPLAISLHAATNAERTALLPINKRWDIQELMSACRYYIAKTGRRLTFEWALINGQNDTQEQAWALGKLLRGMMCHVNLIPLNPTGGFEGGPSAMENVERFQETLEQYGVSSTVRVRRGIDIQAGCGQLRDRVLGELYEKEGIKIDFANAGDIEG